PVYHSLRAHRIPGLDLYALRRVVQDVRGEGERPPLYTHAARVQACRPRLVFGLVCGEVTSPCSVEIEVASLIQEQHVARTGVSSGRDRAAAYPHTRCEEQDRSGHRAYHRPEAAPGTSCASQQPTVP